MGVIVRQKEKGLGNPFWIFISFFGLRKSIKVGKKHEAQTLASAIRIKIGLIKAINSPGLKQEQNERDNYQKCEINCSINKLYQEIKMKTGILKETDVISAIKLIAEENNNQFTVSQAMQLLLPDDSKVKSDTTEYGFIYRFLQRLIHKGDLINIPSPIPGANIRLYAFTTKGINDYGLDQEKITTASHHQPLSLPRNIPQESLKPLLLEDIMEALDSVCTESKTKVSLKDLSERYFPQHNPEKIRQLLKYLEDIGRVLSIQDKQKKLYYPAWLEIPNKTQPISPPSVKSKIQKARGFACEICSAFIGAKAIDGLHIVSCSGCNEEFLIREGWAHRLYPGIKVLIWVPET